MDFTHLDDHVPAIELDKKTSLMTSMYCSLRLFLPNMMSHMYQLPSGLKSASMTSNTGQQGVKQSP
jgi:hypothetical protein